MNANLAGITPLVVGVWCREAGHDVSFVCYMGCEDLLRELPDDTDLVFISAFTKAAQTAYALSNLFRSRGAVTALGGPHTGAIRRTPFATSITSSVSRAHEREGLDGNWPPL
jgi:hypothetical protein